MATQHKPQPADETAVTKPSVVKGLGFPADREQSSQQPTGWQGSAAKSETVNVSRETLRK
jgi:hypothetical protein